MPVLHRLCKPGVEGSIPFVSTFINPCRRTTYDFGTMSDHTKDVPKITEK